MNTLAFSRRQLKSYERTYPHAQKQTKDLLSVYAYAKKYLTRKFEEHKQQQIWTKELLAALGLSPNLVQSLIYLVQRISISQRFKLNKISLQDLRDWAIVKMKQKYYKMKSLDAQVLLNNSPHLSSSAASSSSLGMMFPLSLGKDVVPGQIVAVTGKPVADGFYLEKNNQLVPGWKAGNYG